MAGDKETKIANELAKQLKEENTVRTTKAREKAAADRNSAAADAAARKLEALQKGRYTDHEQKETHWDRVEVLIRKALDPEQTSFQDWRAAMTGLLAMFGCLNTALNQSRKEMWGEWFIPISEAVVAQGKTYFSDKLNGDPEIDLPNLIHEVSFDDEKGLQIAPLCRDDNHLKVGTRLQELFDIRVHTWLNEAGYTPEGNPPKYVKEGVALNKAAFDRLNEEPATSLSHFLEETSEASFRPANK